MPHRPPPRDRPPSLLDDADLRRRRARGEIARTLGLRGSTELDDQLDRDAHGRPLARRAPPRPRGGDSVVGYRRKLPGDDTSDDPDPPTPRPPDGSYSEDPEPPTAPQHDRERSGPREAVLVDPPTSWHPRPVPRPIARRAAPPEEETIPGSPPVGHPAHVRVYLERGQLGCLLVLLLGLAAFAGAGIVAVALALAVVRSAP